MPQTRFNTMSAEEIERQKNTRKSWEKDGLKLEVVWVRDHFCGYVTFKKRPFREIGYDGFLTYVPVHGGITYSHENKDKTMTYGFDCAHAGDYVERSFRTLYTQHGHKWTQEEVEAETEKLAKALLIAKKFELRYLRNISNKGKAKVIDEYTKELGEQLDISDNFGVAINLLGGKL